MLLSHKHVSRVGPMMGQRSHSGSPGLFRSLCHGSLAQERDLNFLESGSKDSVCSHYYIAEDNRMEGSCCVTSEMFDVVFCTNDSYLGQRSAMIGRHMSNGTNVAVLSRAECIVRALIY